MDIEVLLSMWGQVLALLMVVLLLAGAICLAVLENKVMLLAGIICEVLAFGCIIALVVGSEYKDNIEHKRSDEYHYNQGFCRTCGEPLDYLTTVDDTIVYNCKNHHAVTLYDFPEE